jgi:hypothetical protein
MTALHALGPLLNAREMAEVFGRSLKQFYRLARAGAFDCFLVTPAIPPRIYSKALVERYLAGEPIDRADARVRTFGRKRSA